MKDPVLQRIRAVRAQAEGLVATADALRAQGAAVALSCDVLIGELAEALEDEPARLTCPSCKATEHQAPADAGLVVCGNCNHNYQAEEP